MTDLILGILGILILIATVSVYVFQWKEYAKQTRAQVYQNVASEVLNLDRIFIERPYLRPYFYGGETPSQEHQQEAEALAEMYHDFFDSLDTQKAALPEYPWRNWLYWTATLYRESPVMRRFFRENGWWYAGIDFCRLASTVIEEVEGSPVPDEDERRRKSIPPSFDFTNPARRSILGGHGRRR